MSESVVGMIEYPGMHMALQEAIMYEMTHF